MLMNNRLWNTKNPHQGRYKRVLCVCSAGLLRSPTAALVLSQEPYNYNTRAAGAMADFALVPVDGVLIDWAEEIVCMEQSHANALQDNFDVSRKTIHVLGIPDNFAYRDSKLVELIKDRYKAIEAAAVAAALQAIKPATSVEEHQDTSANTDF